jgi:hypothetical protein
VARFIISGSRGTDDLVACASLKGMPDYIKAVVDREKNIAF